MCKKFFMFGGTLALLGFLVFGTHAVSHVTQGVSWVRGQVEESVPIEYEIERAKKLINESGPQIRECKRVIATKQVEIRYLEQEVAKLRHELSTIDGELQVTHTALTDGAQVYTTSGRRMSKTQLAGHAERKLRRAHAVKQMITSKSQRLEALENTLTAAESTCEELLGQRQNLSALVATLEAKRQEAAAKKAATLDLDVDDSNLAKAKSILENVQKRLDVEMQLMENNEQPLFDLNATIRTDDQGDVTDRISAYLGVTVTEEVSAQR